MADDLSVDRDAIRKLSDELDLKKKSFKEKEGRILDRMKEEGALRVTGSRATISVSVNTVPSVKDWDKFYRYVKQHSAFHLLERRPASKAWREEVENRRGRPVPGTEGFEKSTLNLRNT
jgi:Ser-tRNA(Ala) deacylase AlaX